MIANVITLPHRTDRRILFRKQSLEQDIPHRFWEGEIAQYSALNGIARSHKKIVRWAKAEGLKEVLIMEDDVLFSSKGAFQYYLSKKPKEYDIYLAGISTGTIAQDYTSHDFAGFFCYMVHEKYYDKFLSLDENLHIDRSCNGSDAHVCYPMAAKTHDGISNQHRMNPQDYSEGFWQYKCLRQDYTQIFGQWEYF